MRQLEAKLLALGGRVVAWPRGYVAHLPELLARGRPFDEGVRLCRGDRHQCHRNAAKLWGLHFDAYQLCTGYGLCEEGRWLQHTWLLYQGCLPPTPHLLETTYRMQRYFGFVLRPHEAADFWVGNFLWGCGEAPLKAFFGIATLDELCHILGQGRPAGGGRLGIGSGANGKVAQGRDVNQGGRAGAG
jgi:hypothetical protein